MRTHNENNSLIKAHLGIKSGKENVTNKVLEHMDIEYVYVGKSI